MRITVHFQPQTKERLDNMTARFNAKSMSLGVDRLLDDYTDKLKKLDDMQTELNAQNNAIKTEYAFIGEERKAILDRIAEDYSLQSDAEVIDMLLDVYHSSPSIDRHVFDKWMLKRGAI